MIRRTLTAVSVCLLAALASCTALTQMASMLTCQYSLQNVVQPRLAGISLSSVSDVTKMDALSIAKVTTSLLTGSLPLSATVNVGVTNPNQTQAALAGLDWMLMFNGASMLTGSTTQQIAVAPGGGKATVPLTVQVDLAQLFKKENRDQMLSFADGLLHLGEQNSKVTLKINPAVSFGGQVYKTGFIPISKSF